MQHILKGKIIAYHYKKIIVDVEVAYPPSLYLHFLRLHYYIIAMYLRFQIFVKFYLQNFVSI